MLYKVKQMCGVKLMMNKSNTKELMTMLGRDESLDKMARAVCGGTVVF